MNEPQAGRNGHQPPHTFTIIGVGRHGLAVVEHLLKGERWSLVSAVDRSAAAYAWFQSQFHQRHIPFYSTLEEALVASRPQLVYIATTAPAHVPLARAVLATGFAGDLLIEKPVATSLAEADALLVDLAASPATVRTGVNFNRRCSNLYHSAKLVVESGELGRLRHVHYKRAMKLGMKGSHYIDLINWYVGAPPRAVTAWLGADSEVDTRGAFFFDPPGYVEIEYASGQTATIDALDRQPDLPDGMVIEFEHGTVQIDVAETTTCLSGPDGGRTLAAASSLTTYDWIANTFEALADPGDFTACSVTEARDSLAVIVAAYQSQAIGNQPVSFPLPEATRAKVLRLA